MFISHRCFSLSPFLTLSKSILKNISLGEDFLKRYKGEIIQESLRNIPIYNENIYRVGTLHLPPLFFSIPHLPSILATSFVLGFDSSTRTWALWGRDFCLLWSLPHAQHLAQLLAYRRCSLLFKWRNEHDFPWHHSSDYHFNFLCPLHMGMYWGLHFTQGQNQGNCSDLRGRHCIEWSLISPQLKAARLSFTFFGHYAQPWKWKVSRVEHAGHEERRSHKQAT